jgi:hypothetical protein
MTTNDADRDGAEVAAVEAPWVVGRRHPYETWWNSILSKWPWLHRPASAVLVSWRGVAQEDAVHRDSPIGQVHAVACFRDYGFHERRGSIQAVSG